MAMADIIPILSAKINKILECKEKGNELYKSKDYSKAIRMYRKGQRYYARPHGCAAYADEEIQAHPELKNVGVQLHLNLAVSYLHLGKKRDCLSQCDKALKLDPINLKGFLRKSSAYLLDNDYDEAIKVLKSALVHHPNDAVIVGQLNMIKERRQRLLAKQKQQYRGLFA